MSARKIAVLSALVCSTMAPVHTAVASQPSSGTDVAQGRLLNAAGKAVAGARVLLLSTLDDAAKAQMNVGDTAQVAELATTTTDQAGHWTLNVYDSAALGPAQTTEGDVNLVVMALTSDGATTWNFKRHAAGATANISGASSSAASEPAAQVTLQVPADAQAPEPSAGATPNATSCGVTYLKDYGPKLFIIGQTNSATTGIYHDLGYTSGATSSLGVGVSSSGSSGTFSASGTQSHSNSTSIGFNYGKYDNLAIRYLTNVDYGEYKYTCPSLGTITYRYQAEPRGFAGGGTYSTVGFPGANYCVVFDHGLTETKASESAYNFTTGVSTSGSIGINLSTQTGYSSQTSITYQNRTASTNRHLCGSGGYPGNGGSGSGSFIVAKN